MTLPHSEPDTIRALHDPVFSFHSGVNKPGKTVERWRRAAISMATLLCLAACNAPADRAQADFNAAGQALGSGNIGAGANDTGHAFAEGAKATGQAIGTSALQAGEAINKAFNGNSGS